MGVAFALACALVWAISTLIVRTQTYHLRQMGTRGPWPRKSPVGMLRRAGFR